MWIIYEERAVDNVANAPLREGVARGIFTGTEQEAKTYCEEETKKLGHTGSWRTAIRYKSAQVLNKHQDVLEEFLSSPQQIQRRLDQMGVNVQWLIERIDQIHQQLCPGQFGTWQERAEQAELQSAKLAEGIKPILHFIEQWDKQPLRSTSDDFYGIHHGTEFEACLRLSDFRKLLQLMRKPHQRAEGRDDRDQAG